MDLSKLPSLLNPCPAPKIPQVLYWSILSDATNDCANRVLYKQNQTAGLMKEHGEATAYFQSRGENNKPRGYSLLIKTLDWERVW